jgi:hypothetical protein
LNLADLKDIFLAAPWNAPGSHIDLFFLQKIGFVLPNLNDTIFGCVTNIYTHHRLASEAHEASIGQVTFVKIPPSYWWPIPGSEKTTSCERRCSLNQIKQDKRVCKLAPQPGLVIAYPLEQGLIEID